MFFFLFKKTCFMDACHVAKVRNIAAHVKCVFLIFFFKNVYTQNTLKGMRIVLFIVDKYDIVHQFSYCCKVNCDKHIDQINIF